MSSSLLIWFLGAVSASCAVSYGLVWTHRQPSLARTTLKTVSTLTLVIINVLIGGPLWLTVALCFGAIGDAFLSLDAEKGFLPGLGSFLVGHLAYLALIIPYSGGFSLLNTSAWRITVCIAIFIVGGLVFKGLYHKSGAMRWPVFTYIVVIVTMGIAAALLPLNWPMWLAIAAAGLFIFSDFLLSQQLFVLEAEHRWNPEISTVLWACYWSAQVLFLLAFFL